MMNKITLLLVLLPMLLSSCGTNKIIYIADTLVDCEGIIGQKCLQVKENKEDEWTLLSQSIEGFEYNEGFTSKIEVNVIKIKNPPVHSSSLKYKLIKIIYQEKTETKQEKLNFKGKWKVSGLIGMDNLTKSPSLHIDLDSKKISGNAGCNSYNTDFTIEGDKIKFGIPIATKMMCPNMKIEKTFFGCLQNASYYKLVAGELKFYDKEDKELMTCGKVNE